MTESEKAFRWLLERCVSLHVSISLVSLSHHVATVSVRPDGVAAVLQLVLQGVTYVRGELDGGPYTSLRLVETNDGGLLAIESDPTFRIVFSSFGKAPWIGSVELLDETFGFGRPPLPSQSAA